ncbi:hypothetical protein [Lyngbya sp. CCY1209]|uniref:hypothetical protein n=1 Tax=Lyngbya sp. CCY1209 TaxID=2886103 RepID=UPI002D213192|nr:hypothetical protein [Lyngbya sp. CCY1209]MEB3887100.1 hypothetical protein [Lyngbya sp. CCY1209]
MSDRQLSCHPKAGSCLLRKSRTDIGSVAVRKDLSSRETPTSHQVGGLHTIKKAPHQPAGDFRLIT